jgi:hypothetical protein
MAAPARRPSSAAQRTCRPGTPTRTFAVAVLTALGDRNRAVRDAKRCAGEALRVMTDDEGLSVPGSAWGGRGSLPAFWLIVLQRRQALGHRFVAAKGQPGRRIPPGRCVPR